MTLHQASGRWRLGLLLALATALLWASLPVALKLALEVLDPWTLTWIRFLVAAAMVAVWMAWRGQLGVFGGLSRRGWLLLLVAALMLTANYIFYLLGLDRTSPANAQLLIQLAPLLMALGGIYVFRERFLLAQWLGLGLMLLGGILFFSDQLAVGDGSYALGSLFIVVAGVVWAAYALAQKQLLTSLSSTAVMGFIYVFAAVALFPVARPALLLELSTFHLLAVAFCALNTLAAYGAFAEALAHWEASRVSAVLALTPLLTVLVVELVVHFLPGWVEAERIAALGWVGAALVVGGSMVVSLARR
ncbi:MAG TPA: DMT family transporter [Xanthomonadaceae bacterium]|nr:DMT family transporter [Xanthomonadaceae bacterium]